MVDLSGYLGVAQAAKIIDRTPNRVRQLCDEGRLPFVASPIGRLIPIDAAEELAERMRLAAASR